MTISVDTAALAEVNSILFHMNSQLDDQQQRLIQALSPLRAEWVASGSEAGQQFDVTTKKIDQHQSNIMQLIVGFGKTVGNAGETQQAMEKSITNSFG